MQAFILKITYLLLSNKQIGYENLLLSKPTRATKKQTQNKQRKIPQSKKKAQTENHSKQEAKKKAKKCYENVQTKNTPMEEDQLAINLFYDARLSWKIMKQKTNRG